MIEDNRLATVHGKVQRSDIYEMQQNQPHKGVMISLKSRHKVVWACF